MNVDRNCKCTSLDVFIYLIFHRNLGDVAVKIELEVPLLVFLTLVAKVSVWARSKSKQVISVVLIVWDSFEPGTQPEVGRN